MTRPGPPGRTGGGCIDAATADPDCAAAARDATEVEKLLWWKLREGLPAYRFRRQHPIGRHIADFACPARKLVIELDGSQHAREADAKRTAQLASDGYRVIRFWNSEVAANLEGVLETIRQAIETDTDQSLSALQGGEGGAQRGALGG